MHLVVSSTQPRFYSIVLLHLVVIKAKKSALLFYSKPLREEHYGEVSIKSYQVFEFDLLISFSTQ